MQQRDKAGFGILLERIYVLYEKKLSALILDSWWQAMQSFEIKALAEAFHLHLINPDNGQFLPKPADIVRLLQGSTQDSAFAAWTKVENAVRDVGAYESVTFDDALIQQVLQDMGGWIELGQKKESHWPYVKNEFINRYRGYCQRGPLTTWPAVLIGLTQANNQLHKFDSAPPVLIGDKQAAQSVFERGAHASSSVITRLGEQHFKALRQPMLAISQSASCISTAE